MTYLVPRPLASDKQNISSNLDGMSSPLPLSAWDAVAPARAWSGTLNGGDYAPVPPEQEDVGWYKKAVHDFWYYRIHFLPPEISLGNLSGDTRRQVKAWNAFFDPVSLDALQVVNGSGITYTTDATIPGSMAPLELDVYNIDVSASGESVIDAQLVWTIGGIDYSVPVTGQRTVLFPFKPQWTTRVVETLTWNNSLTTAFDGTEQVASLSDNYRRSYSYAIQLRDAETQLYDLLTFGWTGRMFTVPLWNEQTKISDDAAAGSQTLSVDTRYMSLRVGGSIALFRSALDYEVARVEAFTSDTISLTAVLQSTWSKGARVVPLMTAVPDPTFSSTRRDDITVEAAVRFIGNPGETPYLGTGGEPPATYLGDEIYTLETNWREAMPVTDEARDRRVDTGMGPIRISRKSDFPLRTRAFSWLIENRAEGAVVRDFILRRNGRRTPVWVPSGQVDFNLLSPIIQGETVMQVRRSQYGSLIGMHPAMRHVVLIMRDGRRLPRKIVSAVNSDAGTALGLDAGFDAQIDPAQVKRISFLGYYRLGGDDVAIENVTDTVSEISVNFVLKRPPQ